jgi:hypothetical protein
MKTKVPLLLACLTASVATPGFAVAVGGSLVAADINPLGEVSAVVVATKSAVHLQRYNVNGSLLWSEALPAVPAFLHAYTPNGLAVVGTIPESGTSWGMVFADDGTHWALPADPRKIQVSRDGERLLVMTSSETLILSSDGVLVRTLPLTPHVDEVVSLAFAGDAVVVSPNADDPDETLTIYDVDTGNRKIFQPKFKWWRSPKPLEMVIALDMNRIAVLAAGHVGLYRLDEASGSWLHQADNGEYLSLMGASEDPLRLLATRSDGFDVLDASGQLLWGFRRDALSRALSALNGRAVQPSLLGDGSVLLRDYDSGEAFLLVWATGTQGSEPTLIEMGGGVTVDPSGQHYLVTTSNSFSISFVQ